MTAVRQPTRGTRTLFAEASQHTSKTHAKLREIKRPQEPGRPTAPKDLISSTASAPTDLEFALAASGSSVFGDVLGRRSTPHPTRMQDSTRHTDHTDCIAQSQPSGRRSEEEA
jgi:hypothetical protein